jgi:hypothetical protein
MALDFDEAEREALLARGIAFFEDRPIVDSPGPIDDATAEEIEAHIGGPIPEGLLALWRASFGGRVDYSVIADVDGTSVAFAFQELFSVTPGSYRDIFGWIDHEEILAADAAEEAGTAPAPLDYLPFGGFEYLDRFAVKLSGEERGAVYASHDDVRVRVADDVPSFFRRLLFERDPVSHTDEFVPGLGLVSVLAELAADGSAGASAAEKIRKAVAAQTCDWRAGLADGSIAKDRRLCDLALESAAATDDVPTFERLVALGIDVTADRTGTTSPLEVALASRAHGVVRFLLDRAAGVERTIPVAATAAAPELLAELLLRGGEPSAHAALAAAADGALENAALIARAFLGRSPSGLESLVATARGWAARADENAMRLEAGRLTSTRDAASFRAEADTLRHFADLAPALAIDPRPAPAV